MANLGGQVLGLQNGEKKLCIFHLILTRTLGEGDNCSQFFRWGN